MLGDEVLSQRPLALACACALLGFAVLPACIPTVGSDGITSRSGKGMRRWPRGQGMVATLPADPRQRAIEALAARGWRVQPPNAEQSDTVSATRGRSVATVRWFAHGAYAEQRDLWQVEVVQGEDFANGSWTPTWRDHPWEQLRIAHLLEPATIAAQGWGPWPSGTPVTLAAASANHWDPYSVWDPREDADHQASVP